VGDGIGEFEAVRKGASRDVVILCWITPSTEPACWGIVEDGRVGKVGAGIYEVEQNVRITEDQGYRRRAN